MSKSQQVVLVLFAISRIFNHFMIGEVFQVQTDFGLHEPHEGVEPTDDIIEVAIESMKAVLTDNPEDDKI